MKNFLKNALLYTAALSMGGLLSAPLLFPSSVSADSIGPTEYHCANYDSPWPEPELNVSVYQDAEGEQTGEVVCTDFWPLREGRSPEGLAFSLTFTCPGATAPTLSPENNSDGQRAGFNAQCGSEPATITLQNERIDTSDLVQIGCADGTLVVGEQSEVDSLCDGHGGRVSNLQGDCSTLDECGIITYVLIVINILSALVGIIVVIMIAVGGVQYTTARDNPQAVAAARQRIVNALIALVVYLGMVAFLQWLVPGGVFSG